jgi:uncharacterized protein (TIGR00251 family)
MTNSEPLPDQLILSIKVQPTAKKTEIIGLETVEHPASGKPVQMLKIRLAAPPVEGKANQALCAFLAKLCDVPLRNVTLLSGETSKIKRVQIDKPNKVPEFVRVE